MKRNNNSFGEPTESIPIIFDKYEAEIVKRCIENNVSYCVMRTEGESMTCNDERSIPDGSGIFVYDLEIDLDSLSFATSNQIPLNEALVLLLITKDGLIPLVKTIELIDFSLHRFRIKSYNPAPEYNGWLSFNRIQKIYKVLKVIEKDDMDSYSVKD